jgi:16S rRNA A1518/A1519 N6-dimethyltransferase RsmA/KsgA/DIM1 with predicted DNA glycosylase/AP lyase activity
MTYEGIEKLYNYVKELPDSPQFDGFLDIGSGRGKLSLYMAAKSNIIQSVGVELVKIRYDDSLILQSRLERISPKIVRKTLFIHSDIFDVNLKEVFPEENSPIFIWISNLCFDKSITQEIMNKIVNELPSKTVICFSKEPDEIPEQLEKITTIPIPMSWNETSNVNIYRIK